MIYTDAARSQFVAGNKGMACSRCRRGGKQCSLQVYPPTSLRRPDRLLTPIRPKPPKKQPPRRRSRTSNYWLTTSWSGSPGLRRRRELQCSRSRMRNFVAAVIREPGRKQRHIPSECYISGFRALRIKHAGWLGLGFGARGESKLRPSARLASHGGPGPPPTTGRAAVGRHEQARAGTRGWPCAHHDVDARERRRPRTTPR